MGTRYHIQITTRCLGSYCIIVGTIQHSLKGNQRNTSLPWCLPLNTIRQLSDYWNIMAIPKIPW